MDKEKAFWEEQLRVYNSLPYNNSEKYYNWQPARFAGNKAAILLMKKYLKNIKTSCEIGAGSCAFSFSLHNEFSDLSLNAVDISKSAVEYGNLIADDMNIKINYRQQNLFEIKTKYDLVLSLGVIEHYKEEERLKFIRKCYEISNKYIIIAIPNQESIFFKNYVAWSKRKSKKYEEKHEKFNINDLLYLIENNGFKILINDGFQVFLSESKFLSEETKQNEKIISILKKGLYENNRELAMKFPYIDFKKENIDSMAITENKLTRKDRIQLSFMSFILAEKIPK